MAQPSIKIPEVPLISTHYYPDGSFETVETELTDAERVAMADCLGLGDRALIGGNPPIGARLIDYASGDTFDAQTVDKTEPNLIGHAELGVYGLARETVGNDLSRCTLVTTAQPCNTCTSPYAEGKIGKIVYAAPRDVIFGLTGLMRQRKINMRDLLIDGHTDTVVTEGYMARSALAGFVSWGRLRDRGNMPS